MRTELTYKKHLENVKQLKQVLKRGKRKVKQKKEVSCRLKL